MSNAIRDTYSLGCQVSPFALASNRLPWNGTSVPSSLPQHNDFPNEILLEHSERLGVIQMFNFSNHRL